MRARLTTILVSVLGLSVALNASLIFGAWRRAGPLEGPAADAGDERCLLDSLQLDEEQHERLAVLRREMLAKRRSFWRRSAEVKAELAAAICAADTDQERIDSLLERYSENQARLQREVVAHLLRVHAMLRSDQREQFHALLRTEIFRGTRPFPGETVEEP